jgi:hypothetical protein
MKRLLPLIFLSLTFFSCTSKKVVITKSVVETRTDSIVIEKKDSVAVQQNAISINESIDEFEIVPIDTAKPLVINGKTYFNAAIRVKKTNRQIVDTTKITVVKSENRSVEVKKEEKVKQADKKVEKKSSNFWWLWILLVVVAVGAVIRYALK